MHISLPSAKNFMGNEMLYSFIYCQTSSFTLYKWLWLIYPVGLQINLTSARSGFRVSRWKRDSKFRVNCFAIFPLVIDSIGLIPREFNLWTFTRLFFWRVYPPCLWRSEPFNPTTGLEIEVCVQNITPLYAINYEACIWWIKRKVRDVFC